MNYENTNAAEHAVIACLVYGYDCVDYIFDNVDEKDFEAERNKIVFQAAKVLHAMESPIDYVTLVERLEQEGNLQKAGGIEYINQMCDMLPSGAFYKDYVEALLTRSRRRTLARLSEYMKNEIKSDKSTKDLYDEIANCFERISATAEVKDDVVLVAEPMAHEFERIEKAHKGERETFGVKTGFTDFDKCLWGLRRGHLIVVAGRPGAGKTDFALNVLVQATLDNKTCVFFSLEMAKAEIMRRLLAIAGKFDSLDILNGKVLDNDRMALERQIKNWGKRKLFIDDRTYQTPQQILSKAKKIKREHGLDLIVIDYLTKMKPPRDLKSQVAETGELVRNVKDMARQLDCPVLCLAQMNRDSEKARKGGSVLPVMSDLRGSGEIEQEADVVAFLMANEEQENDEEKDILMTMAKNRHGSMRNFKFKFRGNIHRFREIASAVPSRGAPVQMEVANEA